MLQFLYDFLNWQYFGVVAIIWAIIDLVWVGRWKKLLARIGELISKPWIFEADDYPEKPSRLYPRVFLEQLALISKRAREKNNNKKKQKTWVTSQRDLIFSSDKPIRTLGYLISLALFSFFVLADAIIIAQTMVLLAVMGENLPSILQRFDLAILGGALLSAVVGIWMLIEMSADKENAELVNLDKLNATQRKIYRIIAIFTTFFAVIVLIALAVQRLISLGVLASSPTSEIILSFILYGVLAINNSLAAALTFSPAATGFMTVIFLLVMGIIGLLPVAAFFLDVIWRFVFVILDVAVWALFTPIIVIPYGIGMMFGLINDDEDELAPDDKAEEE